MEISWKWSKFCLCLLFFQLCNGYPVDQGDTFTDQKFKLIAGIVSLLLTICGLVFLVGCLCCHRRNEFKEFRNSPVTATVTTELDHGHVNPIANGEFTIFTPLSPPHFNNNIFLASDQIVARTFENQELNDSNLKSWFSDSERDFPRIKLKYIKELGRGWFGKVVEGAAQDIDNKGHVWTPVVVRILDATSSQKEKIIFLQDASIYRCSGHKNILSLFGRCLDTVPFLLLQEYCSQGDLKAYLRSKKSLPEQVLSTEYPLLWCCQLTSALKHLHDNNITHPDLATRNCQLTSTLTLKVGDYGLSVFRYPNDYYQGAAGVPVRWRAPESLTCTQTTIQPKQVDRAGNVWSLGVTMWEICECAQQPYSDLTDDEVVSQVFGEARLRLARPTFTAIYTDYIFRLMQLCWTNAESRPTVSQIHLMLTDLLQVHQNTSSDPSHESLSLDDFDQRWASLKPNSLIKTDDITVHFPGLRKTLSPSLTNLHGSLDNLQADNSMFFEDELRNEFSSANDDSLTSERVCNSDSSEQRISVKKKSKTRPKISIEDDNLSDSKLFQRTSSGSETEDDNWRTKVERGAYTEKVRQKSKSVADLMVLTHVDYSESEPDTPLPSLDYKVNYKNVRLAPANVLETAGVTFASEGNLLSIQDTFQEELRKLQEERRDSLLFVPDGVGSANVANLMQELNRTAAIQPTNQVFNVFNVTVDSYCQLHTSKLDKIINFNESEISSALDVDDYGADTSSKGDSQLMADYVRGEGNCSQKSCQTVLSNEEAVDGGEETNLNLNDSLENINAEHERLFTVETRESRSILENPMHDNLNLLTENKDEEFETGIENPEVVVETNNTNMNLQNIASEFGNTELNGDFVRAEISSEVLIPKVQKLSDLIQNNEELKAYVESASHNAESEEKVVNFDLSSNQDVAMPNSLTHFSVFTSTPFKKKDLSLPVEEKYSSINLFGNSEDDKDQEYLEGKDLKYSLETWDHFLGKTFDYQNIQNDNLFESFSSEPKSLMFVDNEYVESEQLCGQDEVLTQHVISDGAAGNNEDLQNDAQPNTTFVLNQKAENTFLVERDNTGGEANGTYLIENANSDDLSPDDPNSGSWESGGGWFLHPQSNTDDLCGEMQMQPSTKTDTYVGFGIDDEIMSAIRNELISKLPHAQSATVEKVKDDDDWDSCERSEVFLKYNVYNAPLSPIPEESYIEDYSGANSPRKYSEHNDSDWSEHCDTLNREIPSHSPQTLESPMRGTLNIHTPSQDSCCSNDTLFNLEELNFNATELEKEVERNPKAFDHFHKTDVHNIGGDIENSTQSNNDYEKTVMVESPEKVGPSNNETGTKIIINEFLLEERNHASEDVIPSSVRKPNTLEVNVEFSKEQSVPLPSPEENPWKQLPASLVSIDQVASMSSSFFLENGQGNIDNNEDEIKNVPECIETVKQHIIENELQSLDLQITDLDEEILTESSHNELVEPNVEKGQIVETANEDFYTPLIKTSPGNENVYSECEYIVSGERNIVECESQNTDSDDETYIIKVLDEKDNIKVLDEKDNIKVLEDSNKNDEVNNFDNQPFKNELSNEKDEKELHEKSTLEVVNNDVKNDTGTRSVNRKTPFEFFETPIDILEVQFNVPSGAENLNMSKEKDEKSNGILGNEPNDEIISEMSSSDEDGEESLAEYSEAEKYERQPEYANSIIETPFGIYENQVTIRNENSKTETVDRLYENLTDEAKIAGKENHYENADVKSTEDIYENLNSEELYDDYVNIVNMENVKNSLEFDDSEKDGEYMNIYGPDENAHMDDDNIFGVLTDIRFSGPSDSQLMSTSFSENNDDHDWDSGSDSRSSSSGEFIWKEGEHEESLKALRAAPQDLVENVKPMEGIAEGDYEGSDISSSFSDDEGEIPEFVPSAWDKFAIPSKSALRSPEKTLKKTDEKPKGVWFKKQKYHCIYEYPKEPESPVLQSQDLWKPQSDFKSFTDWEFDGESYVPSPGDELDILSTGTSPQASVSNINLYQLTSISDFMNAESDSQACSDEFFISGSSRPFHTHAPSSQFFPGSPSWVAENATPDSGVEDITPASLGDYPEPQTGPPTLRQLASEAANKKKLAPARRREVLGGLRHTRDRLKLDLPPSPGAFVAGENLFSVEPFVEQFVREKPTFSTFGKSRFQVQHVDTPSDDVDAKNVSFEALPYRQLNRLVQKEDLNILAPNADILAPNVEILAPNVDILAPNGDSTKTARGEASVLDSGDEDSGIESSTLERKTRDIHT